MKIWIVNYTSYESDYLDTENKVYTDEQEAVNEHTNNILHIAHEVYEENDADSWFEEHKNNTHISEGVNGDVYKCSVEEFKI